MTNGKQFENNIDRILHEYRKDGKAFLFRNETSAVVTNGGIQLKKSATDFTGIIIGGFAIAFDCKESEVKKGFPKANVKEHQINFLLQYENLGGLGFLLLKHRDDYYYLHISTFCNYSSNYIPWSWLDKDNKIEDIENFLDEIIIRKKQK